MRRNLSRSLILLLVLAAGVIAGCQDAFVSSGILYQEQDKWAKAEQMFKTALWRNDLNADAHYQLAYTYAYRVEWEHLERGEVDSARIKTAGAFEHFMKAAELKPDRYRFNPEAEDAALATPSDTGIRSLYAMLFNKGVNIQADDPEQAKLYFELAALADPRGAAGYDAKLLVNKIRYNENLDNEAAVREVLADTEQLEVGDDWEDANAKRADLVAFKASMYRTLGQDAMAGQLYEGLLASDPDNVDLIRQVANTRNTQGDYQGAYDLYMRALGIAEDDLEFSREDRYFLALDAARAAQEGELYEECIVAAQKALTDASTNAQRSSAARLIARSHYELEQYDDVIATIEPVVLDGGYDPTSLDGWQIYYLSLNRVGRVQEAEQARERFQALRGSN
jgi:tetratricopeptide (TPR) repeat protein